MNLLDFFLRHHREILQGTLEHIWLVGIAMMLAIGVGIPLGVLAVRRPWLSTPILGGANIAETIPSLALFGFLLPDSLAWWPCRPPGHHGARALRAAAHHSQHRRRNFRRGTRRCAKPPAAWA